MYTFKFNDLKSTFFIRYIKSNDILFGFRLASKHTTMVTQGFSLLRNIILVANHMFSKPRNRSKLRSIVDKVFLDISVIFATAIWKISRTCFFSAHGLLYLEITW